MTTLPQNARPTTALLGTKLGMTQVWDEVGRLVPVTVVQVGTNVVTQVRTEATDGYSAIQLAHGQIDPRKVTQPLKGHFEKAGVTPRRHLAEIRTPDAVEAVTLHHAGEALALRGADDVDRLAGREGVGASHG